MAGLGRPLAESGGSWYRRIESGIRRHVRLLRDNDFETYSSCQERMEVALHLLSPQDLERLDALLSKSGFGDYQILVRVERCNGSRLGSSAVVQFGNTERRHRISRRYRSLASWWWEAP
jgi:hypothetical protein